MAWRTWLLCCLTLVALARVAAETAPPTYTLSQCIDIALRGHTDVLVGHNTVATAKLRVQQEKSAYFPRVTASQSEVLFDAGVTKPDGDGTPRLSITETFYDGGMREAKIRAAKAQFTQAAQGTLRARQTVAYTVTRNYYALLRAQQLAAVQDTRITYLTEQLAMVQARVEVGDAARIDVLPLQAQLANARVDRLSAQNTVLTATLDLQAAMGVSPATAFAITEVEAPNPITADPLESYLQSALAQRPEVPRDAAAITAAKAGITSAKIALYPHLSVTGTFAQPLEVSASGTTSISGGIVFDLFDGGRNKAAYQNAKLELTNARLRAEQVAREIDTEVRKAYLALANARERLAAVALSAESAQQNNQAQQERYAQHLGTPLDLLNAQLQVVTAQSDAVNARYDYYTALAQLEYATGAQGGLYETK